jgi:hypothetical protein
MSASVDAFLARAAAAGPSAALPPLLPLSVPTTLCGSLVDALRRAFRKHQHPATDAQAVAFLRAVAYYVGQTEDTLSALSAEDVLYTVDNVISRAGVAELLGELQELVRTSTT